MPEHAVFIELSLGKEHFGDATAREEVRSLKRSIEAILESTNLGDLDGDEFGGGKAVLYLYGPNADHLYTAIEPVLRTTPLRPAQITLRYGTHEDPTTPQRHLEIE